jgi:hypothetical protein
VTVAYRSFHPDHPTWKRDLGWFNDQIAAFDEISESLDAELTCDVLFPSDVFLIATKVLFVQREITQLTHLGSHGRRRS